MAHTRPGPFPPDRLKNVTGHWEIINPETKHCSESYRLQKISGVRQSKIHNVRQAIKEYHTYKAIGKHDQSIETNPEVTQMSE